VSIYVWWVGERSADGDTLARVREHVELEFEVPAMVFPDERRPADTLDPKRGQHSSRQLLAWLGERRPESASRVVGVTDVDLFIPVLTFVFGEAQLDGPAAVVSMHRLREAGDVVRTTSRLVKECVHEVGHTFGLVHCSSPRCVMARSASVRGVDVKEPRLCADCRRRYRTLQQGGLYVYRENENSRRR
jgi:archaemetzincin